jgi:hypothetical protein
MVAEFLTWTRTSETRIRHRHQFNSNNTINERQWSSVVLAITKVNDVVTKDSIVVQVMQLVVMSVGTAVVYRAMDTTIIPITTTIHMYVVMEVMVIAAIQIVVIVRI